MESHRPAQYRCGHKPHKTSASCFFVFGKIFVRGKKRRVICHAKTFAQGKTKQGQQPDAAGKKLADSFHHLELLQD